MPIQGSSPRPIDPTINKQPDALTKPADKPISPSAPKDTPPPSSKEGSTPKEPAYHADKPPPAVALPTDPKDAAAKLFTEAVSHQIVADNQETENTTHARTLDSVKEGNEKGEQSVKEQGRQASAADGERSKTLATSQQEASQSDASSAAQKWVKRLAGLTYQNQGLTQPKPTPAIQEPHGEQPKKLADGKNPETSNLKSEKRPPVPQGKPTVTLLMKTPSGKILYISTKGKAPDPHAPAEGEGKMGDPQAQGKQKAAKDIKQPTAKQTADNAQTALAAGKGKEETDEDKKLKKEKDEKSGEGEEGEQASSSKPEVQKTLHLIAAQLQVSREIKQLARSLRDAPGMRLDNKRGDSVNYAKLEGGGIIQFGSGPASPETCAAAQKTGLGVCLGGAGSLHLAGLHYRLGEHTPDGSAQDATERMMVSAKGVHPTTDPGHLNEFSAVSVDGKIIPYGSPEYKKLMATNPEVRKLVNEMSEGIGMRAIALHDPRSGTGSPV